MHLKMPFAKYGGHFGRGGGGGKINNMSILIKVQVEATVQTTNRKYWFKLTSLREEFLRYLIVNHELLAS